ncbi:MAG TPA: diaminopimelate epimerase [Actinomycetes bacterium]|nr:diaminopimelate epimerase [Actinomycetes bacterium]
MSAPSAPIRFVKGHGTENDFVLLFDPERALDLTPRLVAAICDRRAGIGGDGVLRVVLAATDPEGAPMSDRARWFMDYRNADGSVASMCGNGLRVFARYLVDNYLEPAGEFEVATRAGLMPVRLGAIGAVTVDMGRYRLPELPSLTVTANGRTWPATAVEVPNPHAVAVVDDLADPGELAEPPTVSPADAFSEGVNVEFVQVKDDRQLIMRVHERGVGETRSCGTGACAAAVVLTGGAPGRTVVDVPGGRLTVTVLADRKVELTGPAVLLTSGELDPAGLKGHLAPAGLTGHLDPAGLTGEPG